MEPSLLRRSGERFPSGVRVAKATQRERDGDLVHTFRANCCVWDSALRHATLCSALYFVAAEVLKCSYLGKVIMRIMNWERLNLMNRGMFATFGVELGSVLQILIGMKLEDSVHFNTKHISVSSQQLFN